MKIEVINTDLADAINKASKAISTKSAVPALCGLLVEARNKKVIVTGYDLNMGITVEIEDCIVVEEGSVVLPCRFISEFSKRAAAPQIFIESTDDKIKVKCGKSKFNLIGFKASDYPECEMIEDGEPFLKIDGKTFKKIVKETSYAISENTSKPIYTGALFKVESNTLSCVCIDGFRMAVVKEAIADTQKTDSIVVPGNAITSIVNILSKSYDEEVINVFVDNRKVYFISDNIKLTARLLEGDFLDYKKSIPSDIKARVKIKTRELQAAIERASLVYEEKALSKRLIFQFCEDELIIASKVSSSEAEEHLDYINFSGEEVRICFNPNYVISALKAIDSDEITISLSGSLCPAFISPSGDNSRLHLVVPMRI